MILREGEPKESAQSDGDNQLRARRISDAGGLTQFGAAIHTLEPGATSSDRHWHEQEDELLLMLGGHATLVDNDGEHPLRAGDAVCWPAGEANAHRIVNHSSAPCSYLICGTRVKRDVVHYPDLGRTLHIDGPRWKIVDAMGKVIREGTEP